MSPEAYEASLDYDPSNDVELSDTSDFYPPTRRTYACFDRMCGAQDCPNCYPGTEPQEDE